MYSEPVLQVRNMVSLELNSQKAWRVLKTRGKKEEENTLYIIRLPENWKRYEEKKERKIKMEEKKEQ